MSGKPIMDIKIDFNGPALHMTCENGAVDMIPFSGSVSGELFSGIVEPCGVDAQVVNPAGVRHMSARYMLTGVDADGRACHIYVENDAWFEGDVQMPFRTTPTFMTDSPRLAPYLHRSGFVGEGVNGPDGLHIRFYEAGEAPIEGEER